MSRTRQTASPITTEEGNYSATGNVSEQVYKKSFVMEFWQERHKCIFCLKIEIAPNKPHFGTETSSCIFNF